MRKKKGRKSKVTKKAQKRKVLQKELGEQQHQGQGRDSTAKYKNVLEAIHASFGHTRACSFELPNSIICLMFKRYSFKQFSSGLMPFLPLKSI